MIKFITVLIVALILNGCGDQEKKLAGGYSYIFESSNEAIIVPDIWTDDLPYVPCNVEKYLSLIHI